MAQLQATLEPDRATIEVAELDRLEVRVKPKNSGATAVVIAASDAWDFVSVGFGRDSHEEIPVGERWRLVPGSTSLAEDLSALVWGIIRGGLREIVWTDRGIVMRSSYELGLPGRVCLEGGVQHAHRGSNTRGFADERDFEAY